MKTFESLFAELSEKAVTKPEGSLTVDELAKGTHFIGKKIIEEAGETWIAAEYEGADRTAEEMSQLLYHLQVMMIAKGITLDIQVYNDYVVPNTVVDDGTVDANYFQHLPYLEDFNAQNNTHIVSVGGIHVEPMGLYGGKQTTLDAISGK